MSSESPCGGGCCSCHSNGLDYVAACDDCWGKEYENCDKCEASTDDTDQGENLDDDACDNLFFNH